MRRKPKKTVYKLTESVFKIDEGQAGGGVWIT